MRKPVEPGSEPEAIVRDELKVLERVLTAVSGQAAGPVSRGPSRADFEADMIALRDQIADEKLEDLPSLVEQMTRLASLAAGRSDRVQLPIDVGAPYFAHMRIERQRSGGKVEDQDICIGRRGFIDRQSGVQVVDWRDAPVSQIYYRYDEGDDYDEEPSSAKVGRPMAGLHGTVLVRRNVSISGGRLRRIGCPAGTFVSNVGGDWFELEGQGVALLEGGSGTAARPPRPQPVRPGKRRFEVAQGAQANKQLPEIAALIDRAQFDTITEPGAGLVVIQGGAGSGKTTVALHRIAYLVFHERNFFRPSKCLFVVPSDALVRYVSGVLPALGVQGVPVVTFRSWATTLRRRLVPQAPDRYAEETPTQVSRIKKHPAMLALLVSAVAVELEAGRALLASRLAGAEGADRILLEWDQRMTSSQPPIARVRGMKSVLGRLSLSSPTFHRAEQAIKQTISRLSDARRIQSELMTDRARMAVLAQAVLEPASESDLIEVVKWQSAQLDEVLPDELVGESVDEERLAPVDGRPLDEAAVSSELARGCIDEEDDAILLRLYQIIHGQLTRVDGENLDYDHIAVDEAQDLSAVEIKLLYDATNERRSMTIAGDSAQRVIFDNAFRGFAALLEDIGERAIRIRPLTLAYRSTAPVMAFANAVLGPLASEKSDSQARAGAEVGFHKFDGMGEAVAMVGESLRSLLGREPSASVAVISRHVGQADAWHTALARAEVPMLRRVRRQEFSFAPGVDVTDASQVKGLEFDYVILVDVNDSSYPDSVEARHLLHIGATRATHQLWVIATGPVSPLILEAGLKEASE